MIVCRNLLIDLSPALQQRLIPVFHYALRPEGWLFLGPAENIAARNDLFDAVDTTFKICRRRGAQRQSVAMPLFVEPLAHMSSERRLAERERNGPTGERTDQVVRRIMERYAPAHVVVDPENEILRASGRTGRFLELAEGAPSNKVTDLARRGLRSAVRSVLDTARMSKRRCIKRDVRVEIEDEIMLADVAADPLSDQEILLVFRDAARGGEADDDVEADVAGYSDDDRIKQLEDELSETRTKLRTTVEERANSDLQNFIESTQVPTIFLDRHMRIRNFTPATAALFRFQDQDRGRLFSDVVSKADHRQLEALGRKVLETGEGMEQEIKIEEGDESYVLRVLPFRDIHDAIDGVIFVFSDVTKIRQAQADLALNEGLARRRSLEIETLYKTAPVGMAMVDRNRRYLKVNQHFAELNGQPIDKHIGRTLQEMIPTLSEKMEQPIAEVFDRAAAVTNLEASVRLDGETMRDFLVDLYPYEEDGSVTAVGIILKDVTEMRRLEKELRRLMDELQHRVKNTLATVASIVNQTVMSGTDRADIINSLKMRISALAATHNLLTLRNWKDASLREILKAELTPFDHEERITLMGPPVMLPPKHALTLTLTLHELATNAAKYGALAHEDGRLEVNWMVSDDGTGRELSLTWTESGISGIETEGLKESFGTRLIKNAVVHDLQGSCDHRLLPTGLVCTISVPF